MIDTATSIGHVATAVLVRRLVQDGNSEPDDAGHQEAEHDDPQRAVRRAAVPAQIRVGAADRRDDVDVRRVRREHERRRRAAPGARQRRARQRQREQRVGQIVHDLLSRDSLI